MASYDKPKLLRLLERQHAHMVRTRDVSDRLRDARSDVNRLSNAARAAARGRRNAETMVETLLSLPLDQALERPQTEVAQFIHFQIWEPLLQARARHERLDREARSLRAYAEEHFEIVDELLLAVRKWGFKDPELEIA